MDPVRGRSFVPNIVGVMSNAHSIISSVAKGMIYSVVLSRRKTDVLQT